MSFFIEYLSKFEQLMYNFQKKGVLSIQYINIKLLNSVKKIYISS